MQSSAAEIAPLLGTSMGGGFYGGRIQYADQAFAIIVAPKAEGEHKPAIWLPKPKEIVGAKSYFDGRANTIAMAEAGSKLAQWALDLRIGGFDDWYLWSQDEQEVAFRHLKPTTAKNWCYARSGINLSAAPPTWPYTPDFPAQTQAEAFMAGGAEAFEAEYYWNSTQHASDSDCAWCQDFGSGYQGYDGVYGKLRARAVRRSPI